MLSDSYIIRTLVQGTESANGTILWRELEGGGYVAELHGVRMHLRHAFTNRGSYISLALSHGFDAVDITEPLVCGLGIFGKKYENEAQEELALLMKKLSAVVSKQCAERQRRLFEEYDQIKEKVFNQLLFGAPS